MTVAFHSRGTLVKTEDNEANKGSSKRILNLGFHFCFCVSYPFYPRLPRRSPWRAVILMEVARRRRVIRGRLQKLRGSLAGGALADKIGFLWLNTKSRGCQVTAWATM